jgi:hypothetical protein
MVWDRRRKTRLWASSHFRRRSRRTCLLSPDLSPVRLPLLGQPDGLVSTVVPSNPVMFLMETTVSKVTALVRELITEFIRTGPQRRERFPLEMPGFSRRLPIRYWARELVTWDFNSGMPQIRWCWWTIEPAANEYLRGQFHHVFGHFAVHGRATRVSLCPLPTHLCLRRRRFHL